MKIEMKMPDLATTESEIKVTQWLVEIGQPIKRGEPLLEVETDKAAVEVESYVTGILKEILAEPEDEVDAGAVIAIIEIEGSTPPPGPAEHEEPIAKQQRPAPAAPRKKTQSMFARNRRRGSRAGGRDNGAIWRVPDGTGCAGGVGRRAAAVCARPGKRLPARRGADLRSGAKRTDIL